MRVGVVELPEFIRRAKSILTDAERMELIDMLSLTPEAGVSLGGGVRKLRLGRAGGGKSGGYRVLHYYAAKDGGPVFLLTIFAKNDQANLSAGQLDEISKVVAVMTTDKRRRE